jgi:nucleoprotein TPR
LSNVGQLEADAIQTTEERYSREVIAHAESIKAVNTLREQLKKAHDEARSHVAAAEGAQSKLAASEGSWLQQKQVLEKEIDDLNERHKALAQQNTLLHEHLETVTTQAARIRQAADDTTALPDGAADEGSEQLSDLRNLVIFFRKQSEMNDLKLEVVKQENIRLKAQLEHLSESLSETRQALSQVRVC